MQIKRSNSLAPFDPGEVLLEVLYQVLGTALQERVGQIGRIQ